MPSGLPAPKAPNAAGQAWVDKFVKINKHQIPAGAWIAYTAVKAWAHAVTAVGDEFSDHRVIMRTDHMAGMAT